MIQLHRVGSRSFVNGLEESCLCIPEAPASPSNVWRAGCWHHGTTHHSGLVLSVVSHAGVLICPFAHIEPQAAALFLRAKGNVKPTSYQSRVLIVSPLGCVLMLNFLSVVDPKWKGAWLQRLFNKPGYYCTRIQVQISLTSQFSRVEPFSPTNLFVFCVYVCLHECCIVCLCVSVHIQCHRGQNGCKILWKWSYRHL